MKNPSPNINGIFSNSVSFAVFSLCDFDIWREPELSKQARLAVSSQSDPGFLEGAPPCDAGRRNQAVAFESFSETHLSNAEEGSRLIIPTQRLYT